MKQYIISDPDILSGMPVIKGSRVPVARILFLLKEGYTIEAIHKEFPHLSRASIEGAVNEIIQQLEKSKYVTEIA